MNQTDVIALVKLLRTARLPSSREDFLQLAIGDTLRKGGLSFVREARLGPGERIDFLVGDRIGVEAKTRYPRRSIYRQLERYARHDKVEALILVTGTAMGLPTTILGKPVYYVSLGRGAL